MVKNQNLKDALETLTIKVQKVFQLKQKYEKIVSGKNRNFLISPCF